MFDITFVCPERRDLGLLSVRISLFFGPFPGLHSAICLNSSLFRTVSQISLCFLSEFFSFSDHFPDSLCYLSEFFSFSDRFLDYTRLSVRILLFFGPFPRFHSAICPNSSLFRTVSWITLCYLSEFFSFSDRFPDSALLSVRILLFFGPFPGLHSDICPNSSLFRTVSRIPLCYLSEFFSFSDRFLDYTLISVRILLSFGPFPRFHSAICPNSSLFRTVSWIPLGYLSEFFSFSDRFLDYTLISVRILLFSDRFPV